MSHVASTSPVMHMAKTPGTMIGLQWVASLAIAAIAAIGLWGLS